MSVQAVNWHLPTEESPMDFSLHGDTLAIGYDGKACLWKVSTRQRISTIEITGLVHHVLLSPGGEYLLASNSVRRESSAEDHRDRVTVWSLKPSPCLKASLIIPVTYHRAWSSDGRRLAFASCNGRLSVWNPHTKTVEKEVGTKDGLPKGVRWMTPKTLLVVTDRRIFKMWDVEAEWPAPLPAYEDDEDYIRYEEMALIPDDPDGCCIINRSRGLQRVSPEGRKKWVATVVNREHRLHDVAHGYAVTSARQNFYFWPINDTPPLSAQTLNFSGGSSASYIRRCRLLSPTLIAYSTWDKNVVCTIPGSQDG